MTTTIVSDETRLDLNQVSYEQRARDIAEDERKETEEKERAKKNDAFFMVFKGQDKGSNKIRELIQTNHNAAALFMYISEQMDRTNALVASGKALAEVLGVSEPTISRAIKLLVDKEYIVKFKSGGSNVFVANPEFVWSAWATGKSSCMFNNAKVLMSKGEQDIAVLKRFNFIMEKRHEEAANAEANTKKRGPGRPKKDPQNSNDQPPTPAELEAHGQQRLLA